MNITLCEFDVGLEWSRYQLTETLTEVTWVNYKPGIYVTNFSADYSGIETDYFSGDYTDWLTNLASSSEIAGAITRIGSVFVNSIRVPNAGGLSALETLEEAGFYFDDINNLLYVRFPNNESPDLYQVVAGQAVLASNAAWVDEENGRVYDPDLLSVPAISKTIDPLFFGRIQYNDATISLENRTGSYDNFADFDVYGQEIRILTGDSDTDYSLFRRMWTGYIDDFTISEDSADIRGADRRKLLERPIPVSFYDTTTYTDLDTKDDGKPIPIAYGKVVNVNPICIDKEKDRTTPADYTFVLCDVSNHDGITSVEAIRYKGSAITAVSTNLTTATVVLDDTDLEDANGRVDYRDIEVDFTGVEVSSTAIENGLDVIKDMAEIYGGIPYSNVRYEENTWDTVTTSMPDIGIYIDKDSTVANQIEKIAASLRVQIDVTGDGRFTVRKFDSTAEARFTIRKDDMLIPISAEYSSKEFASRLNVNYVGGVLRYTEEEDAILDRYKTKKPADFDTVLTSSVDATDFAEDIMSLIKDFPPLITITVPIEYRLPEIEDNIYAILNRVNSRFLGIAKCRVEGITYDFNNHTVELALRAFDIAREGTTVDLPIIEILVTAAGIKVVNNVDQNMKASITIEEVS